MLFQPPEHGRGIRGARASEMWVSQKGGYMETNSLRQQVLNSIKNFFDIESNRRKTGLCENCGSSMQFLDAQFQLYGTPTRWRMRVPFCATCESAVPDSFNSSRLTESR